MPDFFVKDFGAVGDGVNDDASHIQAAIDAAAQARGRLRFEGGTFAIKKQLKIPSFSTLEWHDGAALLALPGFTGDAMIHLQGVTNVSLINPQLDGNRQAVTKERVFGVMAYSANVVRVTGGHIRNMPNDADGIYVASTWNVVDPSDNWWVRDTLIENCSRNGLGVVSARYSVFDGLVIRGSTHAGIDIEPDHDWQRAVGLIVRNCICTKNRQYGIVVVALSTSLTGHIALIGNVVEDSGAGTDGSGNGVIIRKFAPAQVIGNVLRNNKGSAIILDHTSPVSLVGNIFSAQHSNLVVVPPMSATDPTPSTIVTKDGNL